MNTRSMATLVLTVLLLSGSNTVAAIKIACIGDSITQGVGAKNRKTQTYPAQLQQKLGAGYEVKNCGTSGIQMRNYLGRWKDKITAFGPDIVTIKLGTNDTKNRKFDDPTNKAQFDARFKTAAKGLLEFLNSLETKPKIYICTPVPVFQDKWGINEKSMTEDIIPALTAMAKENNLKVIDLYTLMKGKGNMVPDGVHPNEHAYTLIAQHLSEVIGEKKKTFALEKDPSTTSNIPGMRTWTSSTGTTIEAQLIRHAGTVVTLKTADGKTLKLPMSKLSEEDQAHIKKLLQK